MTTSNNFAFSSLGKINFQILSPWISRIVIHIYLKLIIIIIIIIIIITIIIIIKIQKIKDNTRD